MFPGDVGPGGPQFQHLFTILFFFLSMKKQSVHAVNRLTCGSLLGLVRSLSAS